jgi:predicted kinase
MRDDELRRVGAARLASQDRNAVADGADPRRGPGSLVGLRERLDGLPDDHPSAPGQRELTADRLTRSTTLDDDRRRRADQPAPLTDAEYAEHVTDVRERLADAYAAGKCTDRLFTTDPDREQWTAERSREHAKIVDFFLARHQHVPHDRQAIIAGGLPGAGKTTVLGEHSGIDLSQYMIINPDDIKAELAGRGVVPSVDGLTPMEASDLAHEESSAIAKQLARKAVGLGMNLVWDITMSSETSTARRIDALRQAGYHRIEGIFIDIAPEVSVRRAEARHRADHEDYRSGTGLGGRYIAPEAVLAQADPEWGSKNRRQFEHVKNEFDAYRRYDNSVDGRAPALAESGVSADATRESR